MFKFPELEKDKYRQSLINIAFNPISEEGY